MPTSSEMPAADNRLPIQALLSLQLPALEIVIHYSCTKKCALIQPRSSLQ